MARFDGIPVDSPVKSKPRFSGELVEPAGSTAALASTGQRSQVAPDGWRYGPSRDLAYGARSVLQGAGGLLGAVGGDAFNNYVANPVARAVGMQEARSYREEASALADRLGLPKAQTAGDRVLGDVGEALTGTGLTLGIGGGINALANLGRRAAAPVTNQLASFLSSQPTLQAVSAATGSGASSVAREAGASQGNQLLAGLAGGLAPGAGSGLASLATAGRVSAAGTVPTLAAGATRRAVRGNNPGAMQAAIDDFAAAGVTPSVGQASGSRTAKAMETYLGNSPGGAGRLAALAEQQANAARGATDRLSNSLANGGADLTPTQVGSNVQQGIYGPGGYYERTKSVSDRLYDEVGRQIAPAARFEVSKTKEALKRVNGSIEGAPNVGRYFQNAKLQGIESALVKDTDGIQGALSRPGVAAQADELRANLTEQAAIRKAEIAQGTNQQRQDMVSEIGRRRQELQADAQRLRERITDAVEGRRAELYRQADELELQLRAEQQAAVAENRRRAMFPETRNSLVHVLSDDDIASRVPTRRSIDSSLPTSAEIEAQIPSARDIDSQLMPLREVERRLPQEATYASASFGDDFIEQQVNAYLQSQADGKLPYEALSKLRTMVGREIDTNSLVDPVPRSKWKEIYGALTQDMEAAATTPAARKAWARANNYYRLRQARLESIRRTIDKAGGPEAAYQAMFSGVNNGATPLKRVMDALSPSVRGDVAAAFLQKMGRATKGQQDANRDAFSMSSFLTNWADVSPEARKVLFSNARFGTDYVQNVDKLARMAGAIKSGSGVFGNPSGTARQTALGLTLGGTTLMAAQSLMQGQPKQAAIVTASTLGLAGANNLLARMMTNPKAVRWLARNSERDTSDVMGQLNALIQIGREEDDDGIVELGQRLKADAAVQR